MNLWSL